MILYPGKLSYVSLRDKIVGKTVRFKSDCEFFPNFDVTGKVTNITLRPNESLIYVKTKSGKNITVGSNMKNLTCEILS